MTGTEAPTVLRRLLEDLPRTERYVLILHYAEQLAPQEIGLILDLPEERVLDILGNLQSRARAELATAGVA